MRLFIPKVREEFAKKLEKNFINNQIDISDISLLRNTVAKHIELLNYAINNKTNETEIQRYLTTDDIKEKFTSILNDVRYIADKVDEGSFIAFKETKFDVDRDFIEVDLITNKAKVAIIREGERVEVSKVTSDSVIIKEVELGGAIEVPFRLLETRQFNRIFDRINDFAISYLNAKYSYLYKLLAVSAQQNSAISYQTGATQVEKDIKTINTAVNTLKQDLKDFISMSYNYPVLIYAHPSMEGRFQLAQNFGKTIFTSGVSNEILTGQPLQFIYTYELVNNGLNATDTIFVLPQVASYFAQRIAPQPLSQTDVLSLSNIFAIRAPIAAGVADTRIARVVNFA